MIAEPPAVVSASALTATLLSVLPAEYSDRYVIICVTAWQLVVIGIAAVSVPISTGNGALRGTTLKLHNQNSSFNPYCMMRGFTLIALIFPKVLGLETLLAGFAKFE